jgi:hypothetical protein
LVKGQEPEPNEPEQAEYVLPTPLTVVQLLSQVAIDTRASSETRWYISGMDFPGQVPEVRVVSSEAFMELKLDQKVDLSYRDESLEKICRDLANRAGAMLFVLSPSSVNDIGVSASMQNVKIRQAISSIADMAGAACSLERGNNFYLSVPDRPKGKDERQSTSTSAPGTYVGKISIPMEGGKYYLEFMLRQNDLPKELSELRDETIRDVLGEAARDAKLKEAIKAMKD